MSVAVDARPPGAGSMLLHAWWLVPEVLAVLLAAALMTFVSPSRDGDLSGLLADEVSRIMEQLPPAEHHDHGHQVEAADRVICEAEVIGMDPDGAASLGDVRTVYAYYMCAAGPPGTPFEMSRRITGPVAVVLTSPPSVRIAQAGLGYADRVRAMFPERHLERAFGAFQDRAKPQRLRARYEAAVANA